MTGLLVVVMKVLMAARKPESSSKMTSTSSNRMSDVAVLLPCSSPGALPTGGGADAGVGGVAAGDDDEGAGAGVPDRSSVLQEDSLALALLRGLLETVRNRTGKGSEFTEGDSKYSAMFNKLKL